MEIDYKKEYINILNDIKSKLEILSIPIDIKRQLSMYISVIEKYDKQNELSYQKAITNLLYIEKQLEKYIHMILYDMYYSIENNQDKDSAKMKTYERLMEIKLLIIRNNLSVSSSKLKEVNKKLKKIKIKLITYITTLSLLLSTTGYTMTKIKDNSKQTVYQTLIKTYTTPGITNYKLKNLPLQEDDYIVVRECFKWEIEGFESGRKVITYNIGGLTYENIINSNLEELLVNFEGTTTYESKYKKDMTEDDEYPDKIYEVIKTTQNKDISFEIPAKTEELFPMIATLLSELLIYMIILGINEGSLVATILFEIDKLIRNNELSKEQIKILKQYALDFEKLVGKYNPSQKTLKKVNETK